MQVHAAVKTENVPFEKLEENGVDERRSVVRANQKRADRRPTTGEKIRQLKTGKNIQDTAHTVTKDCR